MKLLQAAVDVARLLAWAAIGAAGIMVVLYLPGVARRYVDGPPASAAAASEASATAVAAASASAAFPVPDFAAVALTAASLVVAALALVLAIAGVIGYYKIREAAEAKAAEVAERKAAEVAAPIAARSAMSVNALQDGDSNFGDAIAASQSKGGQDVGQR